jgi:hypothetical protein
VFWSNSHITHKGKTNNIWRKVERTGQKTLIGWEASLAGSYAGDMFFVSFISQLVCILNPNYWTSCYRATN